MKGINKEEKTRERERVRDMDLTLETTMMGTMDAWKSHSSCIGTSGLSTSVKFSPLENRCLDKPPANFSENVCTRQLVYCKHKCVLFKKGSSHLLIRVAINLITRENFRKTALDILYEK